MIIVLGRRTSTFILVITVGLTLFHVKKITPPKVISALFVFGSAYLIPLLGALRGDFWELIFSGKISSIDFTLGIDRILMVGDVLELRNAAMMIDVTDLSDHLGYGRGFWNDIVFQYVPGQILGNDFKKSLQFQLSTQSDIVNHFGQSLSSGSTATGLGDSYVEFGFLGCLVFAAIAYLFKYLWASSMFNSSVYSQILYIGLVSPALIAVTHGVGTFFQHAILQFICVYGIWKYSHLPKHQFK
jgi:hypothetical protein